MAALNDFDWLEIALIAGSIVIGEYFEDSGDEYFLITFHNLFCSVFLVVNLLTRVL